MDNVRDLFMDILVQKRMIYDLRTFDLSYSNGQLGYQFREDNVWDAPGVYSFINGRKCPVYIGQSIHCGKRILEHGPEECFSRARFISIFVTPDFDLLERRLISYFKPTLNRRIYR